jgi:hypothetical protein
VRIDVRGSAELRDVILAINQSDREIQRAIRTFTKAALVRPWLESINKRATTTVERRVLAATATVAVSNQNIRITSAAKGRPLSEGLQPKRDYGPVEFGMAPRKVTYSRKGHRVTRTVGTQFGRPNRRGNAFYPAAREMIPRLASLWVQTVVKVYADAFEGKK